MSDTSFSTVINNRGFRFLWLNQVLMQLASNTLNFALIIWVFKLTDSNFAVSALILAVYLPAFLFAIIGGIFADRADKRKIIIIIDLLFALAFLIFPFIRGSYPLILLNTFFINSLTQFFIPAESSSIPLLVSKKQLFVANSLFSFTLYGAFMIGFTIAGPILNGFSISPIFYLGLVLMLVGAFFSQKLPPLQVAVKKNNQHIKDLIVSETKETFRFIRGKLPITTSIGLLALIQGIIGVLAVVIPSYMERVLHIHATDASLYLMLPLGLGMVTGALVVGRFFHSKPKRLIIIPAMIIAGMLLFLVGVIPTIAKLLDATALPSRIYHLRYFLNAPSLSSTFAIVAYLLGFVTVSVIIPAQTILQESTNIENRGKIFAVLTVMMNIFAMFPVLLAGIVADLFGTTVVFVGMGSAVFIMGILALKPSLFFKEKSLPYPVREFLGLGHWSKN